MTQLANTFEGGVAGGTLSAGSGGNTGGVSGNFFEAIDKTTASTVSFGTIAYSSNMAVAVRAGTGAGANGPRWTTGLNAPGDCYSRVFFYADALTTTADGDIIRFLAPTTFVQLAGVCWRHDGKFTLLNASDVQTGGTTSFAVTPGNWYRLETFIHMDAVAGYLTLRVYSDPAAPSGSAGSGSYQELNAAGATSTWAMSATTLGGVLWGAAGGGANWPTATDPVRFDLPMAGGGTWLGGLGSFWNTAVPTVTGNLSVGSTLTANAGTWQPVPSSYQYFWHRADDAAGTNLVEIGATGSTYTLSSADTSKYISAGVIPVA